MKVSFGSPLKPYNHKFAQVGKDVIKSNKNKYIKFSKPGIKIGIIGGLAYLASLLCGKESKPYCEIDTKYVPQVIIDGVNAIYSKPSNLLADTTYHLFGYDTIQVSTKDMNNLNKFSEKMDRVAKIKSPKIAVGTETFKTPYGFYFKTVYKDKFINQKTLLSSNKIYTKDSTDYYVPVKFFGQYNSNLKKK